MSRTSLVVVALAAVGGVTGLVLGTPSAPVEGGESPALEGDALAQALVDTWIDAVGGLDRYWELKTARYTLTTEMYDPVSGRLRRTRPRYVALARTEKGELTRIERWEGDDFIRQGWDGETVWADLNGEVLGPGDRDYDQVPYVSGDVQYWISLPYKLHDDGVNLHYRGRDEEGRHIVGVSFDSGIGLHDGDSWQYWFEDGGTWPVQVAYMEEGRTNWSKLRFEDVRTVDGYVFVGRRVHTNANGRVWKVLRTSDFQLNPNLDVGAFSRP
jgi:hypothetical protein